MKIDKVILQNIGVYVNTNEFDLQAEKPIVLIGGMNGRGKTTLLDSIMFALYGRRSVSTGQALEQYLNRISNVSGERSECRVELWFHVEEPEQIEYRVCRFWELGRKHLKLETRVWKNGREDEFLSGNWDLFVEEILPRAMAPFFFFDGEKIAELVASDNVREISASIRTLLGIDVIDQLIADLQSVLTLGQKKISNQTYRQKLEELEEEQNSLKGQLDEKKRAEEKLEDQQNRRREKLQELENEHAAAGGDYARYREKLEAEQLQIQEQKEVCRSQMLDLAASALPLKLVEPLLLEIAGRAKQESRQQELQVFVKCFPELYREFSGESRLEGKLEEFWNRTQEQLSGDAPVYGLNEAALKHLNQLPVLLEETEQQAEQLVNESHALETGAQEVASHLAVQVEDERIEQIQTRIADCRAELELGAEQLGQLEGEISGLQSRLDAVMRERRSILQQVVQELDTADETARTIRYAQQQIQILTVYEKKLQAMKVDELAAQMTDCFDRLLAKNGLVQRIEIDHDTLEFRYYGRDDELVDSQRFSAGEKQLLVIAMLWALGICSKSRFPLIIDTPLARLDSVHRISLLENYFPKASDQVIILSTDQEITAADYEHMKAYVGKEYTLVYKEETMSTTIQPGYFGREEA